jgi:tetratricopeptide (TPR) repeat protein
MLRPGLLLARFELVSVLGRGGMGEVWRARDLRLGRDVALKVLPEGMAADPDRVARFEREARALAALNHPNVAQIYELGEAVPDPGPGGFIGDEPRTPVRFLVMELVEGESLSRRLRSGPLPLGEALAVARQVVRGLEAAHARGVIHRDLKPGNIMLTGAGEAKVLDFGLARFRPDRRPPDDVDVTANQADSGSVVGTAAYMSPEQVRGEECDERCDIWAFGCCVAEMLSGKRTFDGPTVPDIMTRVLSGHADLDLLPSETPSGVRSLLASCLETSRSRRPTLDEISRALDVSTSVTRMIPRRVPRRDAAAAAVVVTAAVAALLVWWAHPAARPRPVAAPVLLVVLEPVHRGSSAPAGDLELRLDAELERAAAARKALKVVQTGDADLRVRSVIEGRAGGSEARFTLLDSATGAVLEIREAPLGGAGGNDQVAEAAGVLASALEREQVCRELEAVDPLHGFLARRTKSLSAADAFRDGLQFAARTRQPEARQAFERSLTADPGFWPAHLYLALNAKATGRFTDWAGELEAARKLVPHPDEAEAVVIEEVSAMLSEDSQRRLEALERARAFFPQSGELTYRAGQAYRFEDRPAEAIPLFEKLLRSGWRPDWSPTREELAFSQLLAGKPNDVLKTAVEGEARFPTRYKYPLYAAMALQQSGQQAMAREALQRAIRKYLDFASTDPLLVHQKAQYWASLLRWGDEQGRQWLAALAEAERGLTKKPADAGLKLAHAEALTGLGRFAEARTALGTLAAAECSDPEVFLALAHACGGLGDVGCARDALERAASLWRAGGVPAVGTLAYNIAASWALLGDTRQAYEWLLRARDQYGADRLDLALDPDLDSLRRAGLLQKLPPHR